MSAAVDLFSAALDSEGWICIRGLKAGDKRIQNFFAPGDFQGAATEAARLSAMHYNVYFATSTMLNNTSGTAANVHSVKVFKLDLDVGESVPGKPAKYASKQDAVIAVGEFCTKTGLPIPTLVDSGYGVHCYWCLTWGLHPDDGKLYAEKFKAVATSSGLLSDPTCTADVARILRVPDTMNYKDPAHPMPVVLKKKSLAVYDTDTICDLIDVQYAAAGSPTIAQHTPTFLGGVPIPKHLQGVVLDDATKSLLGGKPKNFMILLKRSQESADKGCAQMKWADDHQASIDEPRWRAALSIARFCDDGATAIHDISRGHNGYDPAKTEAKAALTVGPMTCAWFKTNYPTQCDGCKHQVKSPIVLAEYVPKAEKSDNIVLGTPANSEEQVTYTIPEYPFPYFRGKDGGVFRKDDTDDDNAIMVFPYDLYMVSRLKEPGGVYMAHLRLHHPKDGVLEIMLNMKDTASLNDFGKLLNGYGMMIYGKEVDAVRSYVKNWFHHLENKEVVSTVKTQFGWTDARFNSFVLSDREWLAHSWRPSPAAPSIAAQVLSTTPSGSMDMWRKTINLFNAPGREAHAFATLVGFGAVMMPFTEHDGAMVNLYSEESGSGKTAAQHAALSIWGNPKGLVILPKDTVNVRYHRMGVYKNLPICVDEITDMSEEEVGAMLFDITQGRGKERMMSSSNAERVNNTFWQTLVMTSSNTNFTQKIQAEKSAQGQIMRLMEITVPENTFTTEDSNEIFLLLRTHNGHAGPPFVQHIMQNIDRVREEMSAELRRIRKDCSTSPKERYWEAIGQCVLVGGRLAQEAGLHTFDLDAIRKFFYQLVDQMRIRLQMTAVNSKKNDMLGEFLNVNNNSMITVNIDPNTQLHTLIHDATGQKLIVRFEKPDNVVYVAASEFRKFVRDRNGNIEFMLDEMRRAGKYMGEKMVRLAKGTNRPTTPVRCFEFKLTEDQASKVD